MPFTPLMRHPEVKEEMVYESLVFQRYAARYVEEAMKPAVEAARAQAFEEGIEQGLEQGRNRWLEQGRSQGLEQGRSQGLEQGRNQGAIEMLLGLLETRFQPVAVRNLRPLLETIDDVERLKRLVPAAASAESLETFLEALGG